MSAGPTLGGRPTDAKSSRSPYAWGETPLAVDLERAACPRPALETVFLVHSETSTGVVADIQALAAAAKEAGALVVVDAVSSLGAVPLETTRGDSTWSSPARRKH